MHSGNTNSNVSLSKSLYFFLVSVIQTLILFVFFWQRREIVLPSRNLSVVHPTTPVVSEGVQSTVTPKLPATEQPTPTPKVSNPTATSTTTTPTPAPVTTPNPAPVTTKPSTNGTTPKPPEEDENWDEFMSKMAGTKGLGKIMKKADISSKNFEKAPANPSKNDNTKEEPATTKSPVKSGMGSLLSNLNSLQKEKQEKEIETEEEKDNEEKNVETEEDNEDNDNQDSGNNGLGLNVDFSDNLMAGLSALSGKADEENENENENEEEENEEKEEDKSEAEEEQEAEAEEEGEKEDLQKSLLDGLKALSNFSYDDVEEANAEKDNEEEPQETEQSEDEEATKTTTTTTTTTTKTLTTPKPKEKEQSLKFDVKETSALLSTLGRLKKKKESPVIGRSTSKRAPIGLRDVFLPPEEEKSDSWEDPDDGEAEEKAEEEDQTEKVDDKIEEEDEEEAEDEPEDQPLLGGFGVSEDMNKQGLIRGKKGGLKGNKKAYQMEDMHVTEFPFNSRNDMGLFCVFDGHAGKECSSTLVTSFPTVFAKHWTTFEEQELNDQEELEQQLAKLWDDVYLEVDEGLKEFEYEGSTGTTLLIWKSNGVRYLQCANVGDSTAFILRNGKAIALSQDHKPTLASERERIRGLGIHMEEHQSRINGLAVSRAFGDCFPKEMQCGIVVNPHVSKKYKLGSKDSRVIMASDGLWDIVHPQQAFTIISKISDPKEAATKLVRMAVNDQRCHDNVTAIVIDLL